MLWQILKKKILKSLLIWYGTGTVALLDQSLFQELLFLPPKFVRIRNTNEKIKSLQLKIQIRKLGKKAKT